MRLRILTALLLLLVLALPAQASGYVYDGTYHWNAGIAYSRSCVWTPGYWYCGCYTPGYYTCTYYPVAVKPAISTKDPNWRDKVADALAERSRTQMKLLADAYEQQYFMESMTLLGDLRGRGLPGFPYVPMGYAGTNASTLYGYSQQTYNQTYGGTQSQLEQGNRLTTVAGMLRLVEQLGGTYQGTLQGQQALAGQELDMEKVRQQGAVAVAMIRAIEGMGSRTETRNTIFGIGPAPQAVPGVLPQPQLQRDDSRVTPEQRTQIATLWAQSASKCMACHNGGEAQRGKFLVGKYPELPMPDKAKVIQRLLLAPTDKDFMPRLEADAAKPGPALSQAEVQVWLAR